MNDSVKEQKQETKGKRKAIQITSAVTNTGQLVLFALCDDGTIWQTRPLNDGTDWSQTKKIPV